MTSKDALRQKTVEAISYKTHTHTHTHTHKAHNGKDALVTQDSSAQETDPSLHDSVVIRSIYHYFLQRSLHGA
jgi:hypothetical protein